ncbi:MAG: nucleoside kinase [candidate division WOR-3 bacterium]|nr:MAG: nucleoside kinase [candidate division WOR-3 bacterium]
MFENDARGIEDLHKLNAWRRYQSTLSFILYVAARRLFPENKLRIEHSMSRGFYCLLYRGLTLTDIKKLESEMRSIIKEDVAIERAFYSRRKAKTLFKKARLLDKVRFLENVRTQRVAVYTLDYLIDMYAVPPFESTGTVPFFYLEEFRPGFVMVFPLWQDLTALPKFIAQPKLARIFNEHVEWAKILGIRDVGGLNHAIERGEGPEIVKVSEALHEKKIVYIADRIVKEKQKVILIAGPSSAGKTTFTKRLAIQLIVNGIRPVIIATDDYFLPHNKTPKDEFGRLDFESIKAVDVSLLNQHLIKIIQGKEVILPKFNFLTGRRNKGEKVSLPKTGGVVLLEGIHCLNEELTLKVPKSIKFKIYISALTQLNIDDHNRISTTDTRMIRRIVRDTHFRGYKVQEILRHWSRVRRGEERNIYPFQEEADEMFNSALIYEPAVLTKFCVSLLTRIKKKHPEYEEAKRLLDFFSLFSDLNERDVPSNSILREFIGGSSFIY